MKQLILVPFLLLMVAVLFAQAKTEPRGYKIGDIGPSGGLVFYIEGNRYLECSYNLGEANWDDAMQMAKNYRGGGYDDWYLPSKDELNYIYENLRVKGFISDNVRLWSSSESNSSTDYAWSQRFSDGYQRNDLYKSNTFGVRAVRAFTISSGEIAGTAKAGSDPKAYEIGDKGPGGGLVFYIEGNRYWEASEHLGEANWDDAMQMATDYRGGGYDDWYLPTKDELNYIYENLRVNGFISDDGWFWSSSEYHSDNAWRQRFSDGYQILNYFKNNTLGVRAVRAFTISSGEIVGPAKAGSDPKAYEIGDKGPGGGIVFFIEGNRYWEASGSLGKANWWDAMQMATDYRGGGYADWYLPTKDELNYIYENLRVKGFISDDRSFWSSSEDRNSDAWSQRFSDGNQYNYSGNDDSKTDTLGVRAVRAFNTSSL